LTVKAGGADGPRASVDVSCAGRLAPY